MAEGAKEVDFRVHALQYFRRAHHVAEHSLVPCHLRTIHLIESSVAEAPESRNPCHMIYLRYLQFCLNRYRTVVPRIHCLRRSFTKYFIELQGMQVKRRRETLVVYLKEK